MTRFQRYIFYINHIDYEKLRSQCRSSILFNGPKSVTARSCVCLFFLLFIIFLFFYYILFSFFFFFYLHVGLLIFHFTANDYTVEHDLRQFSFHFSDRLSIRSSVCRPTIVVPLIYMEPVIGKHSKELNVTISILI